MESECSKGFLEYIVELLSNLQTVIDEMEVVIDVKAGEVRFGQEDIAVAHEEGSDFDAHEFGSILGEFHLLIKKRYRGRKSNRWNRKMRIGSGVVHVPARHA